MVARITVVFLMYVNARPPRMPYFCAKSLCLRTACGSKGHIG